MGQEIKKKIMDATFSLMEKSDMNSISIRDIAKKAEVNVSAISYYFGGKAELFACMMSQYWKDLVELCNEILSKEQISKEEAKGFCLRFLQKEMQSTGVLRSEQIMYQNYAIDDETKHRIQLQFQAFSHLVTQCNSECDQLEVRIKIVSLLSSLTHPAFWNEIASSMVGDLDQFMKLYVSRLVDQL